MLNRLAAIAAACLLACAPALAQDVRTLPLAAPLTGAEKMASVQGAGCASKTTPCAAVAVTPSLIGTYLAPTFQPRDADLDAIAALSTVDFGRQLLTKADAASVRSALGLGSAALASTGTSGAAVPLLNGTNTWSGSQSFGAGWQTQLGGGTIRPVAGNSAATPGFTVFSGSRAVTLFAGQGYNGLIYDSAGSLVIGREPYANHTGGTVGSSVATATFNADGSTTFAGPVTAPSFGNIVRLTGTNPEVRLEGDANSYYPAVRLSMGGTEVASVVGYDGMLLTASKYIFRSPNNSTYLTLTNAGATFASPTIHQYGLTARNDAGTDAQAAWIHNANANGTAPRGLIVSTASTSASAIPFDVRSNNSVATGGSSLFAVAGNGAATFAGAITAPRQCYSASVCDYAGAGSPAGSISAGIGSTYRRTDGGTGTTFYVKESGTDASGWVAK